MSAVRLPDTISLERPTPRRPRPYRIVRTLLIAIALTIIVLNALNQRTVASPPEEYGAALASLDTLSVQSMGSADGYSRLNFGAAWMDVDHNGCDTRNDVLARDLKNVKYVRAKDNCKVSRGTLEDPYTGKNIKFQRGVESSGAVQIDHVVPLQDAWRKGAKNWDVTKREQFANDPLNLLATDGATNQSKGAKDAAHWLPPNSAFDCQYVARQIAVKAKYGLSVTSTEATAMRQVLAACPAEVLPAG